MSPFTMRTAPRSCVGRPTTRSTSPWLCCPHIPRTPPASRPNVCHCLAWPGFDCYVVVSDQASRAAASTSTNVPLRRPSPHGYSRDSINSHTGPRLPARSVRLPARHIAKMKYARDDSGLYTHEHIKNNTKAAPNVDDLLFGSLDQTVVNTVRCAVV